MNNRRRYSWVDKNVGNKFGRLTILGRGENLGKQPRAIVECECGEVKDVLGHHLRAGNVQSCGCLQTERVQAVRMSHGGSSKYSKPGVIRAYNSWISMKTRCNNPKQEVYKYYGGRGITICTRWEYMFEAFLKDMGERPKGMTLDQIDPDGNYEPGNCRWATPAQQTHNRRCTL